MFRTLRVPHWLKLRITRDQNTWIICKSMSGLPENSSTVFVCSIPYWSDLSPDMGCVENRDVFQQSELSFLKKRKTSPLQQWDILDLVLFIAKLQDPQILCGQTTNTESDTKCHNFCSGQYLHCTHTHTHNLRCCWALDLDARSRTKENPSNPRTFSMTNCKHLRSKCAAIGRCILAIQQLYMPSCYYTTFHYITNVVFVECVHRSARHCHCTAFHIHNERPCLHAQKVF